MQNRRSIRLRDYDYSQAGMYFVTICVQDRLCLFGEITEEQMVLSDAGQMVQTVWDEITYYYSGVETDAFTIMPNHIHGIIVLAGATPRGCPSSVMSNDQFARTAHGRPMGAAPMSALSLPDMVHRFKTMTSKRYLDGVKKHDWPMFPGKLWQRNYYERVIRNDEELMSIREYILTNPARWAMDKENPEVRRVGRNS
jgi:REP element-mobilizing transposase RayT